MTTAPDLPPGVQIPLPFHQAPLPATRPRPLALVPARTDTDAVDFDEAMRRAAPRLQRYALRRLGDRHEAEEVVQEALLRAFQHRSTLATEDDLMAWLTVVTGRLVIDRLRVRGRLTPVAELPPTRRAARDTADVVVARDEARIALDALEAMPTRQAAVLWAREVEGLSYDDIGNRFGLSEPSVRSLLHRARRTLRKEYADRGGTLPGVALVAFAPWLRGLRAAARVRDLARRGATAAAVGVTTLTAVSAVPFQTPSGVDAAPHTSPAISTRADAPAAHVVQAPATSGGVARAAARLTADARPEAPTFTPMRLPHTCATAHVQTGCTVPDSPILYVRMPVPVVHQNWVGVAISNDAAVPSVSCRQLPTTPLSQCAASPSEESR